MGFYFNSLYQFHDLARADYKNKSLLLKQERSCGAAEHKKDEMEKNILNVK